MVARALLSEMTFGTAASRERPLGIHIPYARHVDDRTIRTKTGLLLTTLKLEGYCFETADMSEINARMMARNDLVRMLGNSRFALYQHIIRREVEPGIPSTFDNAFCAELDRRYHQALGKRRMFVNDIYLTILRRPLQGQAGNFEGRLAAILGKKTAAVIPPMKRKPSLNSAMSQQPFAKPSVPMAQEAFRSRHGTASGIPSHWSSCFSSSMAVCPARCPCRACRSTKHSPRNAFSSAATPSKSGERPMPRPASVQCCRSGNTPPFPVRDRSTCCSRSRTNSF
jgi:hypothetical protein